MFKKKIIKKEEKPEEEAFFKIDVGAEIPKLPDIEDKKNVDVKYPLIPPYCYAHIKWDAENNELVYHIEEPELTDREKKILDVLEEGVKELINLSFISVKEKTTVVLYLEKNVKVLLNELSINITSETFLKLMYYLYRDFVGLNELEPLMNDYYIEDVECNGINTPLYVVHRKYRNIRTNLVYPSIERLTSFVEKLAQKCGKYISYSSPLLDGALPDGSRVQSVYTQEVTSRGPSYTIRKFTKTPWSPINLIQKGTCSPEMYAYLWILTEYERSLMVIGATGTGKTSFLNTLAFFIPPQARIVSIEDTKELQLEHENWLPSIARAGIGLATITGQKMGEVTLFDLLKESFRQRPDYVIVGEVRGQEAFVLFQGMASIRGNEEIFIINDNHLKKIKIKELEGMELNKIKAITVDPNTNKIKVSLISGFFKHPPRRILYRIKTETGKEVITTPNHSVFTYTDKIIPREVKELNKGDIIASVDIKNKINDSKLKGEKIIDIKKITLKKPERVYDISIPGIRNFLSTSGILLHNSGHPSMGTMHADSVPTMVKRLETAPINLSPSLVETMDAVCVMIQSKIKGQEVRKLSQINEIIEVGEQGKVRINTPFMWDPKTDQFMFKTKSHTFSKIAMQYGLTEEKLYNEFKLRTLLLSRLFKNNISEFKQVQKIIHEYYKAPVDVLKRYKVI